jgi:HlyD family secretion protein
MKRWLRRGLVLLALAGAALALERWVFRADPVPVTVFRVARGRVEETVTNSKAGTIRTRRRATLSTEVGGRVAELSARKGDRVKQGQLLLRIADDDYRAQVALRERALDAARAVHREECLAFAQADRETRRWEALPKDQIVTEERLAQVRDRRDLARAACDSGEARIREAEAALVLAQAQLAKTALHAPFDGVIADLKTEVGEYITPSPPGLPIPPVLDLIDPESVYVSAPLDEVDVGKVRVGLPVRITMDSFADRPFPGKVTRIAPYVQDVEAQNRTFEVEAEFDDAAFARTLLPGISADVEVILQARDDVPRVPSYALLEGGRVLVVRGDALVAVPVETGLRNWDFAEVTRGLPDGEAVVVSLDRAEVKEGARVRIAGESLK